MINNSIIRVLFYHQVGLGKSVQNELINYIVSLVFNVLDKMKIFEYDLHVGKTTNVLL